VADFDFAAYRRAIEAKDVDAWTAFFADELEWVEYRAQDPPRSPNVLHLPAARAHLAGVCASPLELAVSHEVVGERRVAYRLTVDLPGGAQILEHVILELDDEGRIARQVDVEAWD
jgi:hypothetical protein